MQLEFYQVYLSDTIINATDTFGSTSPSLVLYTNTTLNSTRNLHLISAYGDLALLADQGLSLSTGFTILSVAHDVLLSSKGPIHLQNGTVTASSINLDAYHPRSLGEMTLINTSLNASDSLSVKAIGNVNAS